MGVLRCGSQPLAFPLSETCSQAFWSGVGRGEGGRRATSSQPTPEGRARGGPGTRRLGPSLLAPQSLGVRVTAVRLARPFPRSSGQPGSGEAGAGPAGGSAPVALKQVPSDDQPLDLTGAFINLGDAGITVVSLGRHLCHVAHATQDLNGLRWKAGAQKGGNRPPWGKTGAG